ncbi:type II secretion system F family protein [Marinobacter confluentis]|uniref:Type II secretion system F family protein n=1 Tax=Marinobacter confluentis TaxID=1697557 RepID=A0A4Z1CCD5_9GAMM|nr:type II secretion system F family protein [Marinobacter confluentis]TGN41866.1 type II secretion system F family protein [Marinobacter confluentis]
MFESAGITLLGWAMLVLFGLLAAGSTALLLKLYAITPEKTPADTEMEELRETLPGGFRIALSIADPFVEILDRLSTPRQRDFIRARLTMAGLSFVLGPEEFQATRIVGLLGGVSFFAILSISLGLSGTVYAITFVFFLLLGTFYPDIALNDRIKKRRKKITKMFPFFLDLLVLSLRAGLTFTVALQQSVIKLPKGPLRTELDRCLSDIRAGMPRNQALTKLANRAQVASVSNFMASVNQAEETGAAIARSLEIQAEQRRTERFLEAERLANQAPVKLMFPLMVFLFPLTFLILFFPIVVQVIESGGMGMFQ